MFLGCLKTKKKYLRGNLQKKNSIFTDIAQIGGGEVNPISKILYEIIFWQKEEKEGVQNILLYDLSIKNCLCKVCKLYVIHHFRASL